MKIAHALATIMVVAHIGSAGAKGPVEPVLEPFQFTAPQARTTCPKLLAVYEKAIAAMSAGMSAQVASAAGVWAGQAAEARALAHAGGCSLTPFVDAFLERSKSRN